VRLSRLGLAIAVLFTLLPCGCASDILGPTPAVEGKLTDAEREYVKQLEAAYASVRFVQSSVEEVVSEHINDVTTDEKSRARVLEVFQGAHTLLMQNAAKLREPTPYTMDTLAPINESVASVLESAYLECTALVEKEVVGASAAWGGSALGELLGLQGIVGEIEPSVSARARILASVRRESVALLQAVNEGSLALRAKQEEIESGRDQAAQKGVACFIATAAYGSSDAAEIDVLRRFRDEVLLKSAAGRDYVNFYYAASPPLARCIAEREWLRTLVREVMVAPLVAAADSTRSFWLEP